MDLKVIESDNGGDLVKNTKDLAVIYGFQNMPYLAMFGGNVQESTPQIRLQNRQYFDFWGNNLLFPKDASIQFNSETERVLNTTPLTSSGRVLIEQAIKKDLQFFNGFARVSVAVTIINDDHISIGIKIEQQIAVFIWDATNRELTDADFVVSSTGTVKFKIFDFTFSFDFE